MIIVDSSVWIDYFNGTASPEADRLDQYLGEEPVGIGDVILLEVLQGFRSAADAVRADQLLAAVPVFDMLGEQRARAAAQRYRELRRRGITIRSTIDVAIASFCVTEDLPLLSADRDFDPFVSSLGLRRA